MLYFVKEALIWAIVLSALMIGLVLFGALHDSLVIDCNRGMCDV
jgi:hypothetical protein